MALGVCSRVAPLWRVPPSRAAGHRFTKLVMALASWWWQEGRPGSTYPLVLHSLLRLIQDPFYFFNGHHLERVRF